MYSASAVSSPPHPHVGAGRRAKAARVASTAARPSAAAKARATRGTESPSKAPGAGAIRQTSATEPRDPGRAPTRPPASRASTETSGPGNEPDRDTGQGEDRLRRQHEPLDSRASAAPAPRGRARKVMPNALTKQAAASAVVRRQERPADREGEPDEGVARGVEAEQERLEDEPLADEAVQRRAGRRWPWRPAGRSPAVHGIRRARPPRCSIWRGPGRGHDPARAEEEQALEERVVQDVEERRGQGEDRETPAVRSRARSSRPRRRRG